MICVSLLGLLTSINYLMRLKKEPGTELIDRGEYTKFEPNVPSSSRFMSIFTKRAQRAKMMLSEALSPFCIPVAEKC